MLVRALELPDRRSLGNRVPASAAPFCDDRPQKATAADRPPFDDLGLFSGGLDSLIGAIDLSKSAVHRCSSAMRARARPAMRRARCSRCLRRHYRSRSFDRLRLWMAFPIGLVAGRVARTPTRGRSFLFFALGVFAGTGFEADFMFKVPENGLIALNVPLDPCGLARSARGRRTLLHGAMERDAGGLGIHGRIENPYWDKTKGRWPRPAPRRAATATRAVVPILLVSIQRTLARSRHTALRLLPALPDSTRGA